MIYELNWTKPFSLIGRYDSEDALLTRVRELYERCKREHVPCPSMTYIWRIGKNCGVMAEGDKLIKRMEQARV